MPDEKIILPKELLEYEAEPIPLSCKILIYYYLKYEMMEKKNGES